MVFVIQHSALNSEWKKHKYVTKEDGKYYYPDGTKGARTMFTLRKKRAKTKSGDKEKNSVKGRKSSSKVNKLANAAISGKYGNGEVRKKKLGKRYDKVQNRINQILLGKKAAKRIADSKKEKETGKKALESAKNKPSTKKDTTKSTSTKKSSTKRDTKKSTTSNKKKSTTKKSTSSRKSMSSKPSKSTSSKKTTASSKTSSSVSKTLSKIKKKNATLTKKAKKQALANAKLKGRLKALKVIAKIRS